jgi:predicted glutamine amidotransferase
MIAVYGVQDRQSLLLTNFKQLSQTGVVPEGTSAGHKDGWGLVAYEGGMPHYLGRKPSDPMNSSDYERAVEVISKTRPQIILGHLRKASCGSNSIENTQPFIRSQWSFAHNGTVWSPAMKRLGTENDSAAYFRILLDGLPTLNIESALAERVKKLRSDVSSQKDDSGQTYSSLTCLLSDGRSIYAARDFANDSDRNYYTLYYSLLREGIVFCQEKIINSSWEEIPNRTLVAFNPGERVKIVPCT